VDGDGNIVDNTIDGGVKNLVALENQFVYLAKA